jgi:endonuclease/exonuclease/phosphatase family metal-dependent hydrolase
VTVDPLQPYGPLIDSRLRLLTWNVWGRFGPWERRQAGISAILAEHAPDVVALQEAWSASEDDQARELAAAAGLRHHRFSGDRLEEGVTSGSAVLSRWPIGTVEPWVLPGPAGHAGSAVRVDIDGPRGPVRLVNVMLDWPLHHSHVRQEQVTELARRVRELGRGPLTVVCGDFNAAPDCDEIRMLTGRAAGTRTCWHDAWEFAGAGPGHTWSTGNPWAAAVFPRDRRIDYVFSTFFHRGGAGQPLRAETVGTAPVGATVPSDHYGVLAELRY